MSQQWFHSSWLLSLTQIQCPQLQGFKFISILDFNFKLWIRYLYVSNKPPNIFSSDFYKFDCDKPHTRSICRSRSLLDQNWLIRYLLVKTFKSFAYKQIIFDNVNHALTSSKLRALILKLLIRNEPCYDKYGRSGDRACFLLKILGKRD